ncbi:hypothetical protein HPB49_008532 [Dermacentor silvarum]|uniref:Uncharacterized protein n=1 Tax=Dermacentor silvarum TaxID=543639 RepID=A0ACB8DCA5_DERSI|nr:hypothetical protein HPB49_008532 [Dermacentor silvarum]
MVLYYDPLSKRESIEWRKPEVPLIRVKVTQLTKKIMATIFWDSSWILLIYFKERNATMSAQYYTSIIHKLHDAINEKRREVFHHGVHRLHDNVHTAIVAKAAAKDCSFKETDHSPCGPDLATSDN